MKTEASPAVLFCWGRSRVTTHKADRALPVDCQFLDSRTCRNSSSRRIRSCISASHIRWLQRKTAEIWGKQLEALIEIASIDGRFEALLKRQV